MYMCINIYIYAYIQPHRVCRSRSLPLYFPLFVSLSLSLYCLDTAPTLKRLDNPYSIDCQTVGAAPKLLYTHRHTYNYVHM